LTNIVSQILKTSKPTGDRECPLHVEHAHQINELMNQKAGSCDLDDDEIVDYDVISIVDDLDENTLPPKVKKTAIKIEHGVQPVACHFMDHALQSVIPRPHCQVGHGILNTISSALSPAAQLACNEEQSV
jgi:hypothetical protein